MFLNYYIINISNEFNFNIKCFDAFEKYKLGRYSKIELKADQGLFKKVEIVNVK